jgi:hypothetical protein
VAGIILPLRLDGTVTLLSKGVAEEEFGIEFVEFPDIVLMKISD